MQRIVVKVGSSTLTAGTVHLNRQRMLEIVQQIALLHQAGHEMVLVSSGAQVAGKERLGFPDLGRSVPAKQMLSAVGQGRLMHIYSQIFDFFDVIVAQVLLTREDLSNRGRYLNARDTLQTLIERRIIPIINENDTVATNEIKVGDNDNLSAVVASVLEADLLIMLTDQPGLFTADPRINNQAQLIHQLNRIDDQIYALAGDTGSGQGTGGMVTKLDAAQVASRSGICTVIASGSEPNVIQRIVAGESIGTRIEPGGSKVESRKRWLLTDRIQGKVRVDSGAAQVLLQQGASLLPVGIVAIEGEFDRGATLAVVAPDGLTIAQGLTNYGSAELTRLRGVRSSRIHEILGYSYGDSVIHRNHMVIIGND